MRNGSLTSVFSTFSENTGAQNGSSIYVFSDASNAGLGPNSGVAQVTLINNAIGQASNSGFDFATAAFNGGITPIVVGNTNFISRFSGVGLPGNLVINAQGEAPLLGGFSRSSGPTKTIAPRPGSPLLDAGSGVGAVAFADLTIDQTGASRVGSPSIGAVEDVFTRSYVINSANDRVNETGSFFDFSIGVSTPILTLRDALTAIITRESSGNAAVGGDVNTITFAPSLGNSTITLNPALTSIAPGFINRYGKTAFLFSGIETVTIDAAAAPGLTIDANNGGRIFSVSSESELTVRNLTLTRGLAGGDDEVFTPTAASGLGGAIRVDAGGTLTAEKTLFLNNHAQGTIGAAVGGAIFSSDSTVNLVNSTFVGNFLTPSSFSMSSYTIFGVTTTASAGGAVFMRNGLLNTSFTTFTNNSTNAGGNSIFVVSDSTSGNGFSAGTATVNVSYNILGQAADTGTEFVARPYASGNAPVVTGIGNFIRNNPATQGLPPSAVLATGSTDPKLGPLDNYGGNTKTVALRIQSPLFTTSAALSPTQSTDQRGFARPGGIAPNRMYVGAFEPQTNVATTVNLTAPNSTYGNTSVTATVVATSGTGLTGSSGFITFENFNGAAWIPVGTSSVDSAGRASVVLNSLPAGSTRVRARYTSTSTWFSDSSAEFTFTINRASAIVSYDHQSQVVTATGVRGENLTSGLTLFYSNDGGVTLTSAPPTSTGYGIFYTLTADANHQNISSPTLLGRIAKIVGVPLQFTFDNHEHPGEVQVIGASGEAVSVGLRYYFASESGFVFPDPIFPGFAPRSIGFYLVNAFTHFNQSTFLNISTDPDDPTYTGSTVMIHDPSRVVNLTVTTLVDENDGTYFPAYGTGLSLREAIEYANFHPGPDTITFAPGLNGTIHLNGSAQPALQSDLTITGPGANVLTLNGGAESSILTAVGTSIQVSGLGLSNGNAIIGGALTVETGAVVTIDASDFNSNTATGNGTTNGDGGAILNRGTLTIRNSTLRNNSAVNGGAIFNAVGGNLIVQNSTLAGNAATFGGGLYNTLGVASFLNSTIAYNRSNVGGGIRATTSGASATTTIINTILGGNLNFAGTVPQDFAGGGSFTVQSSNNLIGIGGSGGLVNGTNGNIVVSSVSALGLGILTDNGGPTQTIALKSGSPAIDRGDDAQAAGLINDQRGAPFLRKLNGRVDIGSLESPVAAKLVSVIVNGGDSFLNSAQRSVVTSVVVMFDSPVLLSPGAFTIANIGLITGQAPVALAASQILVSGSGTTYTIRFGAGDGVVTRSTPTGQGRGNSLADGNFVLTVNPTKVHDPSGNINLSPSNNLGDGDNEFGDLAVDNFFRMFGDSDGNGLVNSLDTGAFAKSLSTYNAALDFDGDGVVRNSGVDRINFLGNFNKRRRTLL
ncbi:MAG: hypothetical protein KDA99_29070 [Planctomycetales bacterium]|nr:hypothetical protein [Planctomycetales bacterium]